MFVKRLNCSDVNCKRRCSLNITEESDVGIISLWVICPLERFKGTLSKNCLFKESEPKKEVVEVAEVQLPGKL